MAKAQGKHKRRKDVRAIIELEGGEVLSIVANRGHLKIRCVREGVEALLVTSETGQGWDSTWPAKFRADVRKAFTPKPEGAS